MRTLVRILEQPAAADAVRSGPRVLSYDALGRRAAAFADELRRRELDEGGRVALLLPPGFDLPAALLGCWMAGALAVPLDPLAPIDRVPSTLRRAGVDLLVAHGAQGAALAGRMDWHERTLLSQAPSSWVGQRLDGIFRRRSSPPDARRWGADEPCLLCFEPGGPLVGRLISARAVDASHTFWREELAVGAKDRIAWGLGRPFDLGFSEALVGLSAGAALWSVPRPLVDAPARLGAWLREREITLWRAPPSSILDVLHGGLCDPEPPGDLRCLLCAGAPLEGSDAQDLVRTLPWCRVWTLFADPETGAPLGYELPDWFDPADPPAPRTLPSLVADAPADARPGLRVTA